MLGPSEPFARENETSGTRTRPGTIRCIPSAPSTLPSLRGRAKVRIAELIRTAIADSFHPIAFSTRVPSTSSQMAVFELALVVADEILLGCVTDWRLKTDAKGRDIPQSTEQLGHVLGLAQCGCRLSRDAVAMTGNLMTSRNQVKA